MISITKQKARFPSKLKRDTVKLYTCVSDLQNSCVFPSLLRGYCGGRHANFEDPMLLSQDMRTPNFKSIHFYCVYMFYEACLPADSNKENSLKISAA